MLFVAGSVLTPDCPKPAHPHAILRIRCHHLHTNNYTTTTVKETTEQKKERKKERKERCLSAVLVYSWRPIPPLDAARWPHIRPPCTSHNTADIVLLSRERNVSYLNAPVDMLWSREVSN